MSNKPARKRFWVEAIAATLGVALLLLTLMEPEWIEIVFKIEPDQGSGALELAISLGLLAVAVVSAALAVREWRIAPAT